MPPRSCNYGRLHTTELGVPRCLISIPTPRAKWRAHASNAARHSSSASQNRRLAAAVFAAEHARVFLSVRTGNHATVLFAKGDFSRAQSGSVLARGGSVARSAALWWLVLAVSDQPLSESGLNSIRTDQSPSIGPTWGLAGSGLAAWTAKGTVRSLRMVRTSASIGSFIDLWSAPFQKNCLLTTFAVSIDAGGLNTWIRLLSERTTCAAMGPAGSMPGRIVASTAIFLTMRTLSFEQAGIEGAAPVVARPIDDVRLRSAQRVDAYSAIVAAKERVVA